MSNITINNPVGETLDEIYRWFDILNEEYWDNELPRPVITIQKTRKGNLGHCTTLRCWFPSDKPYDEEEDADTCYYEINFAAQALDRDKYDLVGTLQHELCHLYNIVNGVKDVSGSKMHNKKFKRVAEEHGLVCEKEKSVGYGYTYPTQELKDFVDETIEPNMSKIGYYRVIPPKPDVEKEKRIFKFYCPNCGQKINGKKDIQVICGICNANFTCDDLDEPPDNSSNIDTTNTSDSDSNENYEPMEPIGGEGPNWMD